MAVGSQNAASQGRGGVVLAHVDAVRLDLEGEVGPVVEEEGDAVLGTDPGGDAAPFDEVAGVEVLVPELHDVHAPRDAGVQERGEVGTVGGAEVEAPVGERGRRFERKRSTLPRRWPGPSAVCGALDAVGATSRRLPRLLGRFVRCPRTPPWPCWRPSVLV